MLAKKVHSFEDISLLAQLRQGDKVAFDRLYEKYKKDVFQEAFKRLENEEQAQDITQDVFTALYLKASENTIENLPGYLYISIKNNVYRMIQRQERFVPIPELLLELSSFSDYADANILYNELVNAYKGLVESLPEQQRIIYQMRFEEELNPDEIAERLGISPKTVRNHLGRALSSLRAATLLIQIVILFANKH